MASSGQEDPTEEWEWLSRRLVETLHAESLSRFGGIPGRRDDGLLESALAPTQRVARYEDPSALQVAFAYCEGSVKNHPFADGDKRAGLLAARVFLFKSGY